MKSSSWVYSCWEINVLSSLMYLKLLNYRPDCFLKVSVTSAFSINFHLLSTTDLQRTLNTCIILCFRAIYFGAYAHCKNVYGDLLCPSTKLGLSVVHIMSAATAGLLSICLILITIQHFIHWRFDHCERIESVN